MSVIKTIESTSASTLSFENALDQGIAKTSKTIKNVG